MRQSTNHSDPRDTSCCAQAAAPFKVVHGSVYIAERYVGWQDCVLVALAALFDASTSKFAADTVAVVLAVRSKGCSAGVQPVLVFWFATFR